MKAYQSFHKSVIDAKKGPLNLLKPREYLARRRLKVRMNAKIHNIVAAISLEFLTTVVFSTMAEKG